jgi:hypothetical protein
VQKRIAERVTSGKYSSPEDVTAAIVALDQQEQFGDFAVGEMAKLLAEGERRWRRGVPRENTKQSAHSIWRAPKDLLP